MKPFFLLLSGVCFLSVTLSLAAQSDPKESSRAEERMRDEKRRDEQIARDIATRVKVARFDSTFRKPNAVDIDVFQPGDPVPKEFKAIALLTFECPVSDETQAVTGFITKAKDLGADAVIVLTSVTATRDLAITRGIGSLLPPNERHVFRANAITYR